MATNSIWRTVEEELGNEWLVGTRTAEGFRDTPVDRGHMGRPTGVGIDGVETASTVASKRQRRLAGILAGWLVDASGGGGTKAVRLLVTKSTARLVAAISVVSKDATVVVLHTAVDEGHGNEWLIETVAVKQ